MADEEEEEGRVEETGVVVGGFAVDGPSAITVLPTEQQAEQPFLETNGLMEGGANAKDAAQAHSQPESGESGSPQVVSPSDDSGTPAKPKRVQFFEDDSMTAKAPAEEADGEDGDEDATSGVSVLPNKSFNKSIHAKLADMGNINASFAYFGHGATMEWMCIETGDVEVGLS